MCHLRSAVLYLCLIKPVLSCCFSDVPDAPEDLVLSEHKGRSVKLKWIPGDDHNSSTTGNKTTLHNCAIVSGCGNRTTLPSVYTVAILSVHLTMGVLNCNQRTHKGPFGNICTLSDLHYRVTLWILLCIVYWLCSKRFFFDRILYYSQKLG